jgi:hypothetical protein
MYGGGGDKIWEKMKDKVASIWLTDDMGYITSERQPPVFKGQSPASHHARRPLTE